ncbi:MAG: HlyD family efflux transporter periplasmic adaptor subunit [Proteobacteria bacterium]|nr:HlyD family efflux transporter periplasmic adaptor subunit [Pseudomonadota bacterium]
MSGLFRPEALESQRRDWLGSIQLIRPPSLAWLTTFVVVAVIAVGLFVSFGHYTRKARVAGYLVPDRGVIRLLPSQQATLVESHVAEGRMVHAGDVLFVLAVGQATLNGDTQAAVQASLAERQRSLEATQREQAELARSQAAALDRQIEDMHRELAAMAGEGDLQAQRLKLAQQDMARFESLRNDNFVSSAQVQTKAEQVLGLKAQQQSLERERAAHLRQIAVLEAQRAELPLRSKAREDELQRDLATLAQQSAENEARRRIVMRAPSDGIVTGVLAEVGQSVSPAVAMASLVPADARLEAQLFAPSSAVGFVRAHQNVLLRYQAFPYQKFGHQTGEVVQVSRSPLQASELAGLSLPGIVAGAEPLYRITVRLDRQTVEAYGQAQALAPGMQLDADVLLDRRRLIEWIFEPVLGIAGRV